MTWVVTAVTALVTALPTDPAGSVAVVAESGPPESEDAAEAEAEAG